ncbi:MAG: toll/interleukin-1 receptor domain-containing protein [Vicinamibacterales bacterium]
MRIRGFVSYSTHDRHKAAEVKKVLTGLGVDAFMAHDDIRVSQEWRDTILVELAATEIFVPLLSEAFKSSDWASREVGFAVARPNVLILPCV